MMDRDGFFGPKVSQPAKAKPQWPTRHFWFSQMLMRSLQRCDGEPARSNCLRLAQRVPLARAIAMQRNEQRRRSRLCGNHVVIKFDFGGQRALDWGPVVHRQRLTRSRKSDKAISLRVAGQFQHSKRRGQLLTGSAGALARTACGARSISSKRIQRLRENPVRAARSMRARAPALPVVGRPLKLKQLTVCRIALHSVPMKVTMIEHFAIPRSN